MTEAVFDFRSIAAKLARNEQRDIARGAAKLEPSVIEISVVGGEPMTFRGQQT